MSININLFSEHYCIDCVIARTRTFFLYSSLKTD